MDVTGHRSTGVTIRKLYFSIHQQTLLATNIQISELDAKQKALDIKLKSGIIKEASKLKITTTFTSNLVPFRKTHAIPIKWTQSTPILMSLFLELLL